MKLAAILSMSFSLLTLFASNMALANISYSLPIKISVTDANGQVDTHTYDGLNRVSNVTTREGVTNYAYDRSSLIDTVRYPNNTQASYEYDQALRITQILNQQNNATVSNFEYEYDDNGNRTSQRETNGGPEELTTYEYDVNDRLERVIYRVGASTEETVSYTYDAAYNRTSEVTQDASNTTTENKSYVYNQRNQLTDVQDNVDALNNVSYRFDQNGNQIQKVKNGETTDFVFDIRDDLRQVQIGGSTVGQFLYDYQGLRIEKLGERGAERSTYDDQSVLQQYGVPGCNQATDASCITGPTGNTRAKFDYGPDRLLSLNSDNEPTQFYLCDALQSVTNLTNDQGQIQARYQYDAWGIRTNQVGTSYNRFAFTGYEQDQETGLLYAKARYYDPDTGKFLSEDAWEGDNMIAPSLHRYLYAYQNPTVYVDRSGNAPVDVAEGALNSVANLLFGGQISAGEELQLRFSDPERYKQLIGSGNAFTRNTVHKNISIDLRNFSINSELQPGPSVIDNAKSTATLGIPEAGQFIGESRGAARVRLGSDFTQASKDAADRDLGALIPGALATLGSRRAHKHFNKETKLVTEDSNKVAVQQTKHPTEAMQQDPYHTDWAKPEYAGPRAVGADVARSDLQNRSRLIENKFPDEALDSNGNIFGEVFAQDGKAVLQNGNKVPKREFDFVIRENGSLFIGNKHTTLSEGQAVQAAGRVKFDKQGRVRKITNESGHFRPTPDEARAAPSLLKEKGFDLKGAGHRLFEFKSDETGTIVNKKLDTEEIIE